MITEAILEAVLIEIQERKDKTDNPPLIARCEMFMIDIDTVKHIVAATLSLHLQYIGNGGVAVDAEGACAEAFIAGVICGRMETIQQSGE